MFGSVLGSIGGKLLGDAVGSLSNSLFGGDDDEETWRNQASINWNMQREFLQNQLQWRANDAKAAGIHPVAALGVNPATGSPVAIGGGGSSGGSTFGDQLAAEGAGLVRAATATKSNMERLQERLLETQIQGNEIDNAARASRLALSSGAQVGPGMPVNTSSVPSVPVSLKGTHLDNGPLVNADAVDFDSDPIGYLAARGVITAHDLAYLGRDLKNKFSNWVHSSRARGRQKYFTEGR